MAAELRPDPTEVFDFVARPRLVLFQSVDLEGSTRYKQANVENNAKWLAVITEFIDDFQQLYTAKLDALKRVPEGAELPAVRLWKVLGDELVYCAEVSRGCHVQQLTSAFRDTLEAYNEQTEQIKGRSREQRNEFVAARLRVKGSAWTAGFPVTNAIVWLKGISDYDYIGPSMDMGFRLGKLASPQQLCVSVELAWLLAVFST